MRYWIWLPLLAGMACAISQEDIGERAGEAWCGKAVKCGELAANDEESCIATYAAGVDAIVGLGVGFGAEYDAVGAASCVRQIRSASCDELDDFETSDSCQLFKDDE